MKPAISLYGLLFASLATGASALAAQRTQRVGSPTITAVHPAELIVLPGGRAEFEIQGSNLGAASALHFYAGIRQIVPTYLTSSILSVTATKVVVNIQATAAAVQGRSFDLKLILRESTVALPNRLEIGSIPNLVELAANTFEKTVWPVFRHDRCMNCHTFDLAGEKRDQPPHNDPAVGRHYPFDCTDCHSGSEMGVSNTWISPEGAFNSQARWTRGMSPAALCRQILPEGQGTVQELANHLKTDSRIRWAIEIRKTPDGIVQTPAPVTSMAAFAALVDRWVNLGQANCE